MGGGGPYSTLGTAISRAYYPRIHSRGSLIRYPSITSTSSFVWMSLTSGSSEGASHNHDGDENYNHENTNHSNNPVGKSKENLSKKTTDHRQRWDPKKKRSETFHNITSEDIPSLPKTVPTSTKKRHSTHSQQQQQQPQQHQQQQQQVQQHQPSKDEQVVNSKKKKITPSSSSPRKFSSDQPTTVDEKVLKQFQQRITQLEALVASQSVEIRKLKDQCRDMSDAATAFAQVVELLRQAGLSSSAIGDGTSVSSTQEKKKNPSEIKSNNHISNTSLKNNSSSSKDPYEKKSEKNGNKSDPENSKSDDSIQDDVNPLKSNQLFEGGQIHDDWEIFGRAPTSVMDAADAAGAAILAALLAGKHRMLVDVRDAELTRDADVFVQFIELAILPVAAGLEGLNSTRNRVKLVFPTVSNLLQYRKSMSLVAPEVVALSTLGLDPVEKRDNLVVLIAPSPDDEDGLEKLNSLLDDIRQPVVVVNHHMVPIVGPASKFEQVYHLRLLTVQYMMGGSSPEDWQGSDSDVLLPSEPATDETENIDLREDEDNAALEAALEHAHELGTLRGTTRAMVIRAYPRPWHIFVDTSPDTDADFEVAATFDECPSQDDVNFAIVECLEGSEREDELVAQQMQQALEAGQLTKVSEMFHVGPGETTDSMISGLSLDDDKDHDDGIDSSDDGLFYDDWDVWKDSDTV